MNIQKRAVFMVRFCISDLAMTPTDEGLSITLVIDGEVIDRNLSMAKRDREWLDSQLAALGITEEGAKKISLAIFTPIAADCG